jgi:hypothetical protein
MLLLFACLPVPNSHLGYPAGEIVDISKKPEEKEPVVATQRTDLTPRSC